MKRSPLFHAKRVIALLLVLPGALLTVGALISLTFGDPWRHWLPSGAVGVALCVGAGLLAR